MRRTLIVAVALFVLSPLTASAQSDGRVDQAAVESLVSRIAWGHSLKATQKLFWAETW